MGTTKISNREFIRLRDEHCFLNLEHKDCGLLKDSKELEVIRQGVVQETFYLVMMLLVTFSISIVYITGYSLPSNATTRTAIGVILGFFCSSYFLNLRHKPLVQKMNEISSLLGLPWASIVFQLRESNDEKTLNSMFRQRLTEKINEAVHDKFFGDFEGRFTNNCDEVTRYNARVLALGIADSTYNEKTIEEIFRGIETEYTLKKARTLATNMPPAEQEIFYQGIPPKTAEDL